MSDNKHEGNDGYEPVKTNYQQDGKKIDKIYLWRQLQVTLAFMFDAMSAGVLGGYTATLLPELSRPDSAIPITKSEASWIASAAVLPTAPACIIAGWLLERFGRKRSFFLATLLSSIGWGTIAAAQNVATLVVGRVITGIACGFAASIAPIYVGEVTRPSYRGLFLSCAPLGLAVGPLFIHALSLVTDWRRSALICTIATFLPLTLLVNLPDSHVWYLKRGNIERARKAFYWFRGRGVQAQSELDKLLKLHDGTTIQQQKTTNYQELFNELTSKRFLKPLLVTNVLFSTLQWSGVKTVLFYSIDILKNIIPQLDELYATLILDIIRILTALIACAIVKRCLVRTLTIFSGIGAALSLCTLSAAIHLNPEATTNQIVALCSLLAYLAFISLGLMPIPWVIYGELFPSSTKGFGCAFSVISYFGMFFIIIKISPDLFEAYGMTGTFGIFAGCTMLGTMVLMYILPETKNKTLKDIEEFFVGKK